MQRIAVRAERADRKAVVGEFLFEVLEPLSIVQHRQLAMRIARIVAGPELHGSDAHFLQFRNHAVQRHLRQ